MIFAVNIDNTYITIGVFADNNDCELLHSLKVSTSIQKTSDEYAATIRNMFEYADISFSQFKGAIISSVVPQLTDTISQTIFKLTNITPIKVGPGVKTGFLIKIDSPSEMGADLVANAAAAVSLNKLRKKTSQATIILDLGTATTIFAINKHGEYVGGCIFPGIKLSFDSLHIGTAQLPNVTMVLPEKAIGKNSQDSLRSGVVLGHIMTIDGFISRIEREMTCAPGEANLFATGDYSESILNACAHKFEYEPSLTLKGLYYIYQKNK